MALHDITLDWQTWAALALGLVAAAHVARRWLPGRRPPVATASGCGTPNTIASGCGTGCGGCGQAAAGTTKDHRVHIVRR